MKKLNIAFLFVAASLALSACESEPEVLPGGDEPVVTDEVDECPRADGQPCK